MWMVDDNPGVKKLASGEAGSGWHGERLARNITRFKEAEATVAQSVPGHERFNLWETIPEMVI